MSFSVTIRLSDRGVDLQLSVSSGETVAILGPNGAGKSTLLNTIAGLVRPDSGRCTLDDTVLFDIPARSGSAVTWKPPHRRRVSLLAQEALLFPHLTVLENVAFAPRSAGVPTRCARDVAAKWLLEVDAFDLSSRKPAELSGGQAQRIAVARALASDPGLLLLDEPLAALDVSVAPAVRRMLRRVLADRSAVIVTHDALDAYTLADRVVIVENGRIIDDGTPSEVFDQPRSAFAAGLAGVNLITGVRVGDQFIVTDSLDSIPLHADVGTPEGARLSLAVRPTSVSVSAAEPADPSLATIRSAVLDVEPRGDLVRIRSSLLAADLSPRDAAALDTEVGSSLWFSFSPGTFGVYPTAKTRGDRP